MALVFQQFFLIRQYLEGTIYIFLRQEITIVAEAFIHCPHICHNQCAEGDSRIEVEVVHCVFLVACVSVSECYRNTQYHEQ